MIGMSYGNMSFNKEKIKKSSLEEVMSELTSEREEFFSLRKSSEKMF